MWGHTASENYETQKNRAGVNHKSWKRVMQNSRQLCKIATFRWQMLPSPSWKTQCWGMCLHQTWNWNCSIPRGSDSCTKPAPSFVSLLLVYVPQSLSNVLAACTWLARPHHPLHFTCQIGRIASLPMTFWLSWKGQSGGKNLALHLYKLVCAHNHLTQGAETLGKAPNVYVPWDKTVRFSSNATQSARSWWAGHS